MYIRSQDKCKLIVVKDVFIIGKADNPLADKPKIMSYSIQSNSAVLGKYQTKERAVEVLDCIHNWIDNAESTTEYYDSVFGMPDY